MGFSSNKTFYCDICPATLPNGQGLIDITVPCRVYDESGEKYTKQLKKIAVCKDCFEKFWDVCDSNFAMCEIGARGMKIYPHFETEKDPYADIHWVGEVEIKEKKKEAR